MTELLSVQSLSRSYRTAAGRVNAVEDVSFTLERGEKLGIIGPSGSGKSTLAGLIARFIEPDSGMIRFKGQDITALRGRKLYPIYRGIQTVFQSPQGSFNPRLKLGDGIAEGMRNAGMSKRDAAERSAQLVMRCGVDPALLERYPHQVSGGQCQRCAIARAVALDPDLIIFDEALSALDADIADDILALLDSLHNETNAAYLFISHDIRRTLKFCDRILVMDRGCVVESAPSGDLIEHPGSDIARAMLACSGVDHVSIPEEGKEYS